MTTLAQLQEEIQPDPARDSLGFEEEFRVAQERLLAAATDEERAAALSAWLERHQPCLFGKAAARLGQLGFSFVTPDLLAANDEAIRDHIQADKLRWRQRAARGEQSGFVVLALSPQLAYARPNSTLMRFAQRLAELYLLIEDAPVDAILLDSVLLEVPGRHTSHLIRWDAGVNVFASAADRRWWQDHRIPAGLALSVNSVGHLVKSAQVNNAFAVLLSTLNVVGETGQPAKVESLDEAVKWAMLTIANASEATSGKATWLLDATSVDLSSCPRSNADLPKKVGDKAHCRYRGMYHTDHTIPSSYFRDTMERPADVQPMDLDFTYLYVNTVTNPAYKTMGIGEQIRGEGSSRRRQPWKKGAKQWGKEVPPGEAAELRRSLGLA